MPYNANHAREEPEHGERDFYGTAEEDLSLSDRRRLCRC